MPNLIPPPKANTYKQASVAFAECDQPYEAGWLGVTLGVLGVLNIITACLGALGIVLNIWDHNPHDMHLWHGFILLCLFWSLPVQIPFTGTWVYGRHIGVRTPRGDVNEYGRPVHSSHANLVTAGAEAYFDMEPALRSQADHIYEQMIHALERWNIAHETVALEAAAKRGQLLIELKEQGVLTHAATVDISDEGDLERGREVLAEIVMVRRQIETGQTVIIPEEEAHEEGMGMASSPKAEQLLRTKAPRPTPQASNTHQGQPRVVRVEHYE
jgi:hypothetical protein